MGFASYLEDVLERFLRNAADVGVLDSQHAAAPPARELEAAVTTARYVIKALHLPSNTISWDVVYGPSTPTGDIPALLRPVESRTMAPKKKSEQSPNHWLLKCDPVSILTRTFDIVGLVHDVHTGLRLAKISTPGTLGYSMYQSLLGGDHYSQLSLIDNDLVCYTIRVPKADVHVARGALVRACFDRQEQETGRPWYRCTGLWLFDVCTAAQRRAV